MYGGESEVAVKRLLQSLDSAGSRRALLAATVTALGGDEHRALVCRRASSPGLKTDLRRRAGYLSVLQAGAAPSTDRE